MGLYSHKNIGINVQPSSLIQRMLDDTRFSDIKIIVGQDKTEFKLHRIVICQGSPFFDAACKEGTFLEGTNRVISLPDIEPDAFTAISRWLYDFGHPIPKRGNAEEFCAVYQAADYLGIQALKDKMLAGLKEVIKSEYQNDVEVKDCKVNEPFEILEGLASVSSISDWVQLRQVADEIIPLWRLGDIEKLKMARNDKYFEALVIDSLQEMICPNFCGDCMVKIRTAMGHCRLCGDTVDYDQRVGMPIEDDEA